MTKHNYIALLCCLLLFGGCQSVEQLSIDYMLPAEISFPSTLRKVCVVNNTPTIPDNQLIIEQSDKENRKDDEVARKTNYFNGDVTLATESLAEALAAENYFDEVIICDSALRANDIIHRESTLSKEEVESLTESIGVDFLIALENVQIRSKRKIEHRPEWGVYLGTLDVKAYTTVKVYLPKRTGPMVTINCNDSIFWENPSYNLTLANSGLITDEDMLKEASEFAGTIPVKKLLPYWTSVYRNLYVGGSVEMRDAAVCVRNNDWQQAIELWEKAYEKKKGKQKMYAASNIALGYEMQDSIYQAEEWIVKAQEIAYKVDKIEEKKGQPQLDISTIPNYIDMTRYLNSLMERKEGMTRLKVQMQRFDNDF